MGFFISSLKKQTQYIIKTIIDPMEYVLTCENEILYLCNLLKTLLME